MGRRSISLQSQRPRLQEIIKGLLFRSTQQPAKVRCHSIHSGFKHKVNSFKRSRPSKLDSKSIVPSRLYPNQRINPDSSKVTMANFNSRANPRMKQRRFKVRGLSFIYLQSISREFTSPDRLYIRPQCIQDTRPKILLPAAHDCTADARPIHTKYLLSQTPLVSLSLL